MSKPKIIFPPDALNAVPPEERERVKAELEELLKDFDPDGPIPEGMRQIHILPPGPAVCPVCGDVLQKVTTISMPPTSDTPGATTDLFDCTRCDTPYEREAANLPASVYRGA